MIGLKNKTYYTLMNKSVYIYILKKRLCNFFWFFLHVSYNFWHLNQNIFIILWHQLLLYLIRNTFLLSARHIGIIFHIGPMPIFTFQTITSGSGCSGKRASSAIKWRIMSQCFTSLLYESVIVFFIVFIWIIVNKVNIKCCWTVQNMWNKE